ncbi:hypothetical protein ACFOVU_14635 [Nocardiopsis sediminis]|uniref:Uncharacterized protein n=1 Tax=Nocardiopsis sediminis TaxID=1778267 RepID=A0ABV8FQA3_9ACTN
MPRKLRRVSAFFKILTILTLVCGALVAGGIYVMRSIKPLEVEPEEPAAACTVTASGDTDVLDPEQAANAATIGGVAFARDLPEDAVVIAYATVWQESKFFNIDYGDRDSVGLFQQRPSKGWGETDQLLDPVYATGAFYESLVEISGYEQMPVYEAAQAVQASADGFAYDQHEQRSRVMASAFTGAEGAAMTCVHDPEGYADPDPDAARTEITRVFGVEPTAVAAAGRRTTGDLGWAMALWAVANAGEYGLTQVTYDDQRWTLDNAEEGWATVPDAAPAGEVVLE